MLRAAGRRRVVAVAAILGGVAVLVVPAGAAGADPPEPTIDGANWYWAEQQISGLPAATPTQASGINAGDLGVAYTTSNDKTAAVQVGLADLPSGALIQSFTLTMPLDGQQVSSAPPPITACELLDPFPDAPGPSPASQTPTASGTVCSDGVYEAGSNAYTFDLTAAAQDWSASATVTGVLVAPSRTASVPFNYAFVRKAITAKASYQVAPAAATGSSAAAPAAPAVVPATAPLPPAAGVVRFPSSQPAVAVPAPLTAPVPAPAAAPAAPAPVAYRVLPLNALRPSGWFWLAAVALAGLLLLLSLVLGDPLAPVPPDPRRRRFAAIVSGRPGPARRPPSADASLARLLGRQVRPA